MAENNTIQYIESHFYKPEHQETSNKDKDCFRLLLNNQYIYNRFRKNKSSLNWHCHEKKNGCKSSITTDFDSKIIRHISEHNHEPLEAKAIEAEKFLINVKKRIETEHLPAQQIYQQEQASMVRRSNLSNEQIANLVPAFNKLKPCLSKRRSKIRPSLPSTLKEIQIDGEYLSTTDGKKFLIHKSRSNKILVFASIDGLKALSASKNWHADGTFKKAAKHYYQLYIIQAWYENRMIPACWILMNRRRQKEYDTVLKAIIKEETDIPQEEIERFTCEDCGTYDYDMYMVNDDIWSEYGNESNTLCMNCLEKRIGRKLTKDDFSQYKNAPANKYNPQVKKLFNSGRFRFRF